MFEWWRSLHLSSPMWLWLLLLIPIAHRAWMRRNRPARVRFSLPLPEKVATPSPVRRLLWIRYAALGVFVFALARPQLGTIEGQRSVSGIDIMMVLDFSESMNIEDLGEKSRTEIAKATMEEFIRARHNDRIGFVMFAGEPLTLSPPTLDYGLVLKALHDAQIGQLRDGTAIGDALAVAVGHLRDSRAKSRIIILLTDGENNLGQIDPVTAGDLAAGYGIRVYTIAIGKEGRVKLPIRTKGVFGTVTQYQWFDNALNPELLQQISKTTNGKFYRVTEGSALESVFREIDQLEKNEIKTTEQIHYDEKFRRFLEAGFLLLLIEQILARGWWRLIP